MKLQSSALLSAHLMTEIAEQGGIGPAGLASEDLHVLDFTDFEKPRWHRYVLCASLAPASGHLKRNLGLHVLINALKSAVTVLAERACIR